MGYKMFSKSFLEDEVRDGFYVPSTIKQAWAAELEVLSEIDTVCKKLHINYFAEWGTLLGAIRHQGFVPWDDDIDISMKREDYIIFMENAPSLLPDGYTIHTFRNEEGFREFRATVINSSSPNFNKDHFDKFHGFCYLCGVDIYVLDYVLPNYEGEEKRFKDILYLISLADSIIDSNLSFSKIIPNLKHVEEITGVSLLGLSDRTELWLNLYELVEKKCAELLERKTDSISLLIPWGLKNSPRTIQPLSDYENAVTLPFEYIGISVPNNYTSVISRRFSNFKTPVKQSGSHNYPFFQKQIDELNNLLGQNVNEFSFDSDLTKQKTPGEGEWKLLLRDALNFLIKITENISQTLLNPLELTSEDYSLFIENIVNAQDTAIEAGNLIEAIKGSDYPCIQVISCYCEQLYNLYNYFNNLNISSTKNNNSIFISEDVISSFNLASKSLFNSLQKTISKKEIVFLPFKSSAWDSFADIYSRYSNNDNYDIFVIPIPYYFKEYDSSLSDIQYDIDSYPKELNLFSYNDFSLEYHKPDIVFIQNPYDRYNSATSIHPDFYSSKIINYTNNLIYVPWFKTCEISDDDSFSYTNMKYYVTMPGVVNSDFTLVYSTQEREAYIKKLIEWSGNSKYFDFWSNKIQCIKNFNFYI